MNLDPMNTSTIRIDQALLDVRKAYRLLYDYQRVVLDTVDYIGNQFGLKYIGGWPKFSGPAPRNGGGKLTCWSWDWLNMVLYDFHFAEKSGDEDCLRLSVLLISDTGYFCAEDETVGNLNVAGYLVPERSATKLGFFISGSQWMGVPNWEQKGTMKAFIQEGKLPSEYAEKGIIGRCVDLARLASEQQTNDMLDELVLVANRSGIPLQRISPKAKTL